MAQPLYTKGTLSYPNKFTDDELLVIIDNGEPITVAKVGDGIYGKLNNPPDYDFPIRIAFENGVNEIAVKNMGVGEVNVKIQSVTPSKIETTECFKKAVRSVSVMMLRLIANEPLSIEGATWQEAYDALTNGAMVYLNYDGKIIPCVGFGNAGIGFSHTYVDDVVYTDEYVWRSNGSVRNDSITYPPQ